MTFILRPFDRVVELGDGARSVRVRGEIKGAFFVFCVAAAEYPLPTARCDADSDGRFAEVDEAIVKLPHGFILQVEPDSSFDPEIESEPLPPGCRVAITRPNQEILAQLLERGVKPDEVNVVVPNDASLSVYFTTSGHICGWGGSYSDREPNDPRPH